MNLATLLKLLEELAWDEQVEFEMGERHPESVEESIADIERKIQELGARLSPELLDALEAHEDCDPRWLLRLCPYVTRDDWRARATRFLDNEDSEVRYWAKYVLERM